LKTAIGLCKLYSNVWIMHIK